MMTKKQIKGYLIKNQNFEICFFGNFHDIKLIERVIKNMNQLIKRKIADGKRFIRKLFRHITVDPADDEPISDGDKDLNYLKNRLFDTISFYFVILGPILFFYGAYLFYQEGKFIVAGIEFSLYFIILLVLANKKISGSIKKLCLIGLGYFASLLVLIVAGPMGAGMVCVTVVLVLSGSLLEKNQVVIFIAFNLFSFSVITVLLATGFFYEFAINNYGYSWLIVSLSSQILGIGLMFLIQSIYTGMENQAKIIVRSRATIRESEQKYRYLSYHDHLTGVYNRLYWEEEQKRIDRENQLPISVIVGDINGIKLMNDAFGHEAGDRIILETAKIMKSCCHNDEIVARTGGDEFSILLPKTARATVMECMEEIQQSFRLYNRHILNEAFHINVALGTGTKETPYGNLKETIKMAEMHMNQRKLLEQRSSHSAIISSIKGNDV